MSNIKKILISFVLIVSYSKIVQAEEFIVYGKVKDSYVSVNALATSTPTSPYTYKYGSPDIMIGIVGAHKQDNITYLYRVEIDIDSMMTEQTDAKGKGTGVYAFTTNSTYIGALTDSGVYVVGKLSNTTKKASAFLDTWVSAKIDPFSQSAGYIPGIPIQNQNQGQKSLLELVDNSFLYVSPEYSNIKYGVYIAPGTSKDKNSLLAQKGIRANYSKGDLKLGIGINIKDKTTETGTDGVALNILAAQYRWNDFVFGLAVNSGTKADNSISGNYVDVIYNYGKYSFHYGVASFKNNETGNIKDNSGTGMEVVYKFSKVIKAYVGMGNNLNKVNSVDYFKTDTTSFGVAISF